MADEFSKTTDAYYKYSNQQKIIESKQVQKY